LTLTQQLGRVLTKGKVIVRGPMAEFRCFFMDERGHIMFPAEITADNLEIAKRHAFEIFEARNDRATPEFGEFRLPIASLEIWAGGVMLFQS
jgi:hypothetical protein